MVSPGQWTQDLRGGSTGGDWSADDWRTYGRLESHYHEPVAVLMGAQDDARAMRFWAGGAGWAGLLRALFLTIRPEQDERPEDPGHVPWRLRGMKEKWGSLRVRTTGMTPYQDSVVSLVQAMSAATCIECGAPGSIRSSEMAWIRPVCDACWSDEEYRAVDKIWREPQG